MSLYSRLFRPHYNHIICLTAAPKQVFRLLPWIMAALLALGADDQPNWPLREIL
jgi:hypothetical protein